MSNLRVVTIPEEGRIVCGDNLEFMKALLDEGMEEKIDFIYIDPPFFTGRNFSDYKDTWKTGMTGFTDMLRPRFELMQRLLSETGLIAVHLDYHAVHYVKVLMDEIFGMDNFINEIIWAYKSGGASPRSFARKHDNILLYSKTGKYFFSPQKEISYNRGGKPYHFKGVDEFCDENGRWYTLVNQKDVVNIDMVGRTSSERTGYSTQKPEALLKLLISSCCREGGICADFFAGSGTTGAAAKALGRQYILCDLNPDAYRICASRLKVEQY